MNHKQPEKDWKYYSKLYCKKCDEVSYRKGNAPLCLCLHCESVLRVKDVVTKEKPSEHVTYTKEKLSHIRTLPNGKQVGVTNKGEIIDSADFRQKLNLDPHGERSSGIKDAFGNLTRRGKGFA